jgi:hypothetical protein
VRWKGSGREGEGVGRIDQEEGKIDIFLKEVHQSHVRGV